MLELDGFGYQATLLSKLTLGSVVVAPTSHFPLWVDDLLVDGEHLIRPAADLADLPRRLGWLAAHDARAAAIATAGQRRVCQLLAPPHVAGYVARLLKRYAELFTGQYHDHIAHGRVAKPSDPRLLSPERLWFMRLASAVESERDDQCARWWLGRESCDDMRRVIGKGPPSEY